MDGLMELLPVFYALLNNAILLFGLGFMYAAVNYDQIKRMMFKKVLLGLTIGFFTLMIMLNPWTFDEGVFFDTRSILIAVTGMFFGPLTTGIAVVIPLVYRLYLGGPGVYAGTLSIITSATIGLTWFRVRGWLPKMTSYVEFLLFGLIVHIVVIMCFLLIPWPTAFVVIRSTLIPYLVLFPILTMLLAQIVDNQRDRMISHQKLSSQQILLQASIDSTKAMEVYAVDKDYCYMSYNEFHRLSMRNYYGVDIENGANFLDYIENAKMKLRLKSYIDQALHGAALTHTVQIETNLEKFVEEQYAPILNDDKNVVGVTIFSQDISERKKYESSILYLSYRDPLTNLYNRRYYNEELDRLDQEKYEPLTIITSDINGLKIMNDAFGHDAGDLLLCTVADELVKVFKSDHRVARIGGDEFVILLPNTTHEKALLYVDQAKEKIEKHAIYGMGISVSFGIATHEPNENIRNLMKRAEDDMYTHKLFEVSSHRNETIKTILNTLHEKNPREEQHSARVARICNKIGTALHMKSDEIKLLQAISNLHDIGKIAIDDAILNKPGKLDDKEWEMIKKHPEIGYRILSASPEYSEIALDILSHHERYDGKGYPRGIQAEDIPLRARIISIADSYDAMVSERPYRKPLSHLEAIAEIRKHLGTQFDPKLGQLFIDLFENEESL